MPVENQLIRPLQRRTQAVATISDQQQTTVRSEAVETPHEEAGGASLDKVRDILFGGQMRDLDRRFARVEERLTKETLQLEDDLRKRLATVESFARAESEALAQRIKAEYDARSEATSDLSRQMQDRYAELEKKAGLLDDQIARAQRELRQQILETHQRLADEIREKVDAVLARLRQEADDLRTDKADRVTLAALFTEMAMRLTHEPSARGEQEPRGD
jgi:Skp family chaperone for outer membrane proteins